MSLNPLLHLQLGDVVDPRTFWAHETKRVTRSVLRVRRLEARLAETARLTGAQLTAATPPGVAVAVARRGPGGDTMIRLTTGTSRKPYARSFQKSTKQLIFQLQITKCGRVLEAE